MQTSVLEVKKDGLEVILMDGSSWSINTGDSTKTSLWYPTQRIEIEKSDSELYPYILINLDTYGPDKAKASQI